MKRLCYVELVTFGRRVLILPAVLFPRLLSYVGNVYPIDLGVTALLLVDSSATLPISPIGLSSSEAVLSVLYSSPFCSVYWTY